MMLPIVMGCLFLGLIFVYFQVPKNWEKTYQDISALTNENSESIQELEDYQSTIEERLDKLAFQMMDQLSAVKDDVSRLRAAPDAMAQ